MNWLSLSLGEIGALWLAAAALALFLLLYESQTTPSPGIHSEILE